MNSITPQRVAMPTIMPNDQPNQPELPCNPEAETALLGAILVEPASLSEIEDRLGLGADDFYIIRNRWIWQAFLDIRKQNQPIDYLTVCEQLTRAGQLSEIGGSYLTSLLNAMPDTRHAEAYAAMVIDASIRRRLLTGANKVAVMAYDKNTPVETILNEIPGSFPSLSGSQNNISSIEDVALEYMQGLDDQNSKAIPCHCIIQPDGVHDVIYGVTDLTNNLGGIPIGSTTLVAGATGTGKTTWGLEQAMIASHLGYKTLYISTETSGVGIIRKITCGNLGISPKLLRKGEADDTVLQSLKDEANNLIGLHSGKLFFDSHSNTIRGIKASIARICPDLVMIDHLGELLYDGENRTIGIGENFTELGQYCKHRGGIALVVFHHIDISVTDRPTLNDLRWAKGDLSQKADIVITMFRKDLVDAQDDPQGAILARKTPVPVEFWIRKDREGPRDVLCKSVYDLRLQKFETPTNAQQQTLFE